MKGNVRDCSVLIVAGEASGDMHGAGLVREIHRIRPDVKVFGMGGEAMRKQGVRIVQDVGEMAFLGFFEVLRHLPKIRRVFRTLKDCLEERKPDLVVLIDYPGFNLRFAKTVKKRGIPVVYYISPQVWAWGSGRVKRMVDVVDLMLVIFPFEEPLYRAEGMDVRFVGHPLKDEVKISRSKRDFFRENRFRTQNPLVGLLPGSREQEIKRLLPQMLKALGILRRKMPGLQAAVGMAPTVQDAVYESFLDSSSGARLVRSRTYEIMAHSDAVMVASGTATLETALLGTPMVILYKMAFLSYVLGRMLVKVKHIGLVNIVAGRKVVPELIQNRATPERIAEEVQALICDRSRADKVRRELQGVSERLGQAGAAHRAAEAVVEFLGRIPSVRTEMGQAGVRGDRKKAGWAK